MLQVLYSPAMLKNVETTAGGISRSLKAHPEGWRMARCAIFPFRYVNSLATPTLERHWTERRRLCALIGGARRRSGPLRFLVVAVKHRLYAGGLDTNRCPPSPPCIAQSEF